MLPWKGLFRTPDLLCHPVRERTIYTSRPPTCGFDAAVPIGYRHMLLRSSPIAAGLLRVHAEDKLVWERFLVGGPGHRDDPTLGLRSQDPGVRRTVTTGDFLGCSGWPRRL